MESSLKDKIHDKLMWLTRKWWFYLILLLFWFLPFISTGSLMPWEMGDVISEVLRTGLKPYLFLEPFLHVLIIVMIVLVIVFKNKFGRIFAVWIAVNYVLVAFLQNIALTQAHGIVILLGNLVLFLIVAGFWSLEAVQSKNDYDFQKPEAWKWWVVPLAVLAFWLPVNSLGYPDFNPLYFLISESPLAFCMITPVYLAVISFIYPGINRPTIRVTSFLGTFYGVVNISLGLMNLITGWWMAVVHVPLLSISLYMFVYSIRSEEN
ncbi:MAG: hypothetical protein ACXQS8_05555 [Candidatus Helarchaeales archaeon]